MKMSKVLFTLMAVMLSACAIAKPHTVTWTWPTTTCDGDALAITDLLDAEIIYSLAPMPMSSDVDGPCAGPDGDPPAGSITVPFTVTPTTSYTLNLQPGQTYYARIRVNAFVNGNWSSWSSQATFTVPYGKPQRVIISSDDRWGRHVFEMSSYSTLHFTGR